MKSFFFTIGSMIVSSSHLFPQDLNEIIEPRMEFLIERMEGQEIDLSFMYSQLLDYFHHPLNLNFASAEELGHLGLLTAIQIQDLLVHRKSFGSLITLLELQTLTYWDLETIERVLPFVFVHDKLTQPQLSFREVLRNGHVEVSFRYQRLLQEKEGYRNTVLKSENKQSYYFGNSDHYYTRFLFRYRRNLSVGWLGEKDPGEVFFTGNQGKGFDFYSGHLFFKGGKYLRTFTLGDYQIQIGQGLMLWSGYSSGKSSDAINVKKSAAGIQAYTSVDETRFLRGSAIELGLEKVQFSLFASSKKVDAVLQKDTLLEETYYSSISQSGLHRTEKENLSKKTLQQKLIGGNLRYRTRAFNGGLSALYYQFDQGFKGKGPEKLITEAFGSERKIIGVDYNYTLANFNFFGEVTFTDSWAELNQIHGVLVAIGQRMSLSFLHRDYSAFLVAPFANALSEGGKVHNERGFYSGYSIKLPRSFTLNSYLDIFSFPWLKYQVSAPSIGHELLLQIEGKPRKTLDYYFRFRQQVKQKDINDHDGAIKQLVHHQQRNYRIQFSCQLDNLVLLKSRVEYVTVQKENAVRGGVMIAQDLNFHPIGKPFDVLLRFSLFQTSDYSTRIYVYESNVPSVYSMSSLYGKGSRAYVMLHSSFLRLFDVWCKYGVTIFEDRKTIGTGLEQIEGALKSEITVQLRIKL
jgi:hypothetical protein